MELAIKNCIFLPVKGDANVGDIEIVDPPKERGVFSKSLPFSRNMQHLVNKGLCSVHLTKRKTSRTANEDTNL